MIQIYRDHRKTMISLHMCLGMAIVILPWYVQRKQSKHYFKYPYVENNKETKREERERGGGGGGAGGSEREFLL